MPSLLTLRFSRNPSLLALALALGAAIPAGAQTLYTIGANAGLVVPTGDLSEIASSGYTIAATLGMHAPLTPIGFRVEGSFTQLPYKSNVAGGGNHNIYGFSLDGNFNLGTASTNGGLYLTGGLGYFGWKAADVPTLFGGTSSSETTWDLGLNAGLGYYLPLSGFTMYFEGRYRKVFSTDFNQGMFPITVGITF